MTEKLKPCPCCGSKEVKFDFEYLGVFCHRCGYNVKPQRQKIEDIFTTEWNNQPLIKVKECPFCDGKAFFEFEGDLVRVVCSKCAASAGWSKSINTAVEMWNRRSKQ